MTRKQPKKMGELNILPLVLTSVRVRAFRSDVPPQIRTVGHCVPALTDTTDIIPTTKSRIISVLPRIRDFRKGVDDDKINGRIERKGEEFTFYSVLLFE